MPEVVTLAPSVAGPETEILVSGVLPPTIPLKATLPVLVTVSALAPFIVPDSVSVPVPELIIVVAAAKVILPDAEAPKDACEL